MPGRPEILPLPAPAPSVFRATFRLAGLPPLESRAEIVTEEEAAARPGPWFPHPLLPGRVFTWVLINPETGEAASPSG